MQSPGLKKVIERNRDDPAYELRQSAHRKGSGVPRAGDGERLLQSGIRSGKRTPGGTVRTD